MYFVSNLNLFSQAHSGGHDRIRRAGRRRLLRRPLVQSPAAAAPGQRHRGTAGEPPPPPFFFFFFFNDVVVEINLAGYFSSFSLRRGDVTI